MNMPRQCDYGCLSPTGRPSIKYMFIVLSAIFFCRCSLSEHLTHPYHVHIDPGASRTSGVAPLSVQFTAGFSNSTTSSREFHNLDCTWDFGDDDTAVWATTGRSKNTAKGPVAAHLFESPGSYTVSLTVRDTATVIDTESFAIEVQDPDDVYGGTDTVCVSDAVSNDFAGCPDGAQHIATDLLDDVAAYVEPGVRMLFRRGSSWTTDGISFAANEGPVTIGAYGAGTGRDDLGMFDNAPRITVATGGSFFLLDYKQDWRITDLHLVNDDKTGGAFGGAINMQRILFQRLRVEGFEVALGWSHWNSRELMAIDQMVLSECLLENAAMNVAYVGAERIALLGNVIRNARDSHVLRVWQAYLGVISDNIVSGSSIESDLGRHALKLHGPGYSSLHGDDEYGTPREGSSYLEHRTEFAVVSDNVFGSSGPWPVAIGPQDTLTNSLLTDIIFERNRIITNFGEKSSLSQNVSIALHVAARFTTVRNNVFDGTGSGSDYSAIGIWSDGAIPVPAGVDIYNNTIYRSDNAAGWTRFGITVDATAQHTTVKNNLVSFPDAASGIQTAVIDNSSADLIEEGNLLADDAGFADPDNAYADDPFVNSFNLLAGSAAIDAGVAVPVYEDIDGKARPDSGYDIGAYEN